MTVDTNVVIKAGYGVVEETRKLARIVLIDDVLPHPNADALELAVIGGWQLCVKLGEYKKGDRAIYCEIDSLLPIDNELFSFLEARRSDNRNVDGKNYHRLKTIKLRSELSQGLLVPVPKQFNTDPVDTNLTLKLGILKYEKAPPQTMQARVGKSAPWVVRLGSKLIGNLGGALLPWPSALTKSDQDRVQNKTVAFNSVKEQGLSMEVTYKLDGSSMTVFCINDGGKPRTGICSRNYELGTNSQAWSLMDQVKYWLGNFLIRNKSFFRTWKLNIPQWVKGTAVEENNFVRQDAKEKIQKKLLNFKALTGRYITVQGELIGPDIQSNFEDVKEHAYYVYSVYEDGNVELLPKAAQEVVEQLGLNYVPILSTAWKPDAETKVKDVLAMAEGKSAFNNKRGFREGLVFKANDRVMSWKAISNKYLLKIDN